MTAQFLCVKHAEIVMLPFVDVLAALTVCKVPLGNSSPVTIN